MWPDANSGFEADPFSPAGTAERFWAVFSRKRAPITGRQEWAVRLMALAILGFAVVGAVVFALSH